MKVPGGTSGPTLCRSSLLYTKLSAVCVLKLRVICGSKCGGSQPRTRRMPPRLGVPASAPQSVAGRARGQADSVTPAARPALRNSRRRIPGVFCVCCVCIGHPPASLRQPGGVEKLIGLVIKRKVSHVLPIGLEVGIGREVDPLELVGEAALHVCTD